MPNRTTLASLSLEISTEADAYLYFENLRWNGNPVCAHCDSTNVYFIDPANGVSRATRTAAMSQRRVWRCRTCKKQFSVITNTIMHGTKVSIRIWVMVIFEMMASKNGVAAREVERKYGITPCSAWFMLHRIREAMSHDDAHLFTGNVVADETFIGGEPKNRHRNAKGRNSHARQKTPVMALIDADTGEARYKVIADVSARTLRSQIVKNVDLTSATLHSDGWGFSKPLVASSPVTKSLTTT
jgi:transposase-like protein